MGVTAFVMTGGASLGAVHVGMLAALYEQAITPQLIVGTSVGAVNGAYIASREQTPATANSLGEVWRRLRRSDVFPIDLVEGLFGFLGRHSHFVPSRSLRRLLKSHLEVVNLDDLPIPTHVIATDAATGEEIRLSSGPVLDAVLASAAIPGIFPPVKIDGRALIDGGTSNFAPISQAIALGADTVYVLTSGSACALSKPPRGAIPMFLHSNSLLVTRRLRVEVDLLADRAKLFVIPPPCPLSVAPHDFSQANRLIESAYGTAVAYLSSILDDVSLIPLPTHLLGHVNDLR